MNRLGWRKQHYLLLAAGLLLLGTISAYAMFGSSLFAAKTTAEAVYQPPHYLGIMQLPEQGLKPNGVFVTKSRLYVSYFGLDQIDIFTKEGKKEKSFKATLKPNGLPQGMGLIGDRLLVADYRNRALSVFNPQGNFLEAFSGLPNQEEFIPVGVAVYNRVFYVTNKKVNGWMAIGDDGELINVLPGKTAKNTLKFPYGIVVTDDGRVIVSDTEGGKIKVFACPGWYIYDFPTAEVGLLNPQGIALDWLGRLHVVDNGTNQIFVYDNKGRYLFKYGEGLEGPSNIAIDKEQKKIYITNTEKGNLAIWVD